MKKLITVLMVLFITVLANITMLFAQSNNITRFGIYEKEINNLSNYKNPYTDVDLMVVLTETFKKQHFIKGFYDGGGKWKIRFSPSNHSRWNYQYQFTDGKDVFTDHFDVTPHVDIQPIEVNSLNSSWFKRGVDPFFVKGTHLDWSVLTKNDTTQLRNLKKMGFNLIYLENVVDNGFSLFPLDYNEYAKIEPLLTWLYDNDMVIMLPVYVFPLGHKPKNQYEWNNYLSYFFSRLGVYRNIMLYIPENDGLTNISVEEKNQIVSAIIGNNPYEHPFAIFNDSKKFVNKYIQFNLANTEPEPKSDCSETIVPLVKIVSDQINKDPKKLIPYLCSAFTNGNSGIIDYKKVSDDLVQNQLRDLWLFFQNIPYFEMKPVRHISNLGSCIGSENDEYVLYLENSEKVNLSLGNNYYLATWINPFNASNPIDAGTVSGETNLKTPSKNGSWLLHLSHKNSGFPMGIHLSWSEAPNKSITVTWTTVSQDNSCKVKYRKKGTYDLLEQKGTSEKSPGGEVWIHSVVLRNLESETDYEYQVSADKSLDNVFSQIYLTRTAPTGKKSSFSFSVITDTGLEGRLDNNATGSKRFIHELVLEKPDFLLGIGDYGYANRDKRFKTVEGNIIHWFKQSQPALASMPIMEQYGNHELYLDETYEDWAPFFKHSKGFGDNRHFSFDIGNVHFTSFCIVDKLPSKEELEWLENDIAQARLRNQWLIVYHHEPTFAYGTSHPSKKRFTEIIYPLLRKYNVDLNIYAHDQSYERTYQLTGADAENPQFNSNNGKVYKQGEGTVFMKLSPCGKKSEIGNIFPLFQETQPPFIAMQDRTAHHMGIFNVQSGNSIEIKIYNIPEDDSPKYLIDHFIITK